MPITLNDLRDVRWETAARLYGNAHSSLLGLIVDMWIRKSPEEHCALEEFRLGDGNCVGRPDAILVRAGLPIAVVEVEGSRACDRLEDIRGFLRSSTTGRAAVLVAYAYEPRGRRPQREFPRIPIDGLAQEAHGILQGMPGRVIAIVSVNKRIVHRPELPEFLESHAEYCMGIPCNIQGLLVTEGGITPTIELWPRHQAR